MINTTNEGSKLYLYSITSVAILGGLLFGYDTAVISGAEKGLEAFFLSASDFQYNKVMHGITSSSALTGCVLGGAFSGIFASRLGRRNSLRLAAVLFFLSALGSYYPEFLFFEYGKPNMDLLVTFNLYRVLGGICVCCLSDVYRRNSSFQHSRNTCFVQPVCHYFRYVGCILCELPDYGRSPKSYYSERCCRSFIS